MVPQPHLKFKIIGGVSTVVSAEHWYFLAEISAILHLAVSNQKSTVFSRNLFGSAKHGDESSCSLRLTKAK